MSTACFRPEDLDALRSLKPEDPRLRHLQECPRCRWLLASYEEFITPGVPRDPSELAEAEAALSALLRAEAAGARPPSPLGQSEERREGPGSGGAPARPRPWGSSRWSSFRLGWRPLAGLAGAALVTVAVLHLAPGLIRPDRSEPLTPRGLESPLAGEMVVRPAQVRADGALEFHWRAQPEADQYQVLLYNSSLEEIARLPAGADTMKVLEPGRATALRPASGIILWQVVAFSRTDEIARSRAKSLHLP
jgi:hypothetical protein